jgi:hypothetical protein
MRIFIAFFRRWQALAIDTGRKVGRGQRGFNGSSRLMNIDWDHGAFRFLVLTLTKAACGNVQNYQHLVAA